MAAKMQSMNEHVAALLDVTCADDADGENRSLYRTAIDAVKRASDMCHGVQRGLAEEDTKAKQDDSPVTIADYAAQAVIALTLKQNSKGGSENVRLVAEEDANELRDGGRLTEAVANLVRTAMDDGELTNAQVCDAIDVGLYEGGDQGGNFWVLDPIDGTRGFVGRRQYAVCLGYVDAKTGDVLLGVLGCPNLPFRGGDVMRLSDGQGGLDSVLAAEARSEQGVAGSVFFAAKGKGTYVGPLDGSAPFVAIGAKARQSEEDAPPAFMESYDARHSDHSFSGVVASTIFDGKSAPPPLRVDSQCKYGLLAMGGIADIYMRFPPSKYREKIWDHVAGICVVEEAGGVVSDAKGRKLRVNEGRFLPEDLGGGICAGSSQSWHGRLVDAIAVAAAATQK